MDYYLLLYLIAACVPPTVLASNYFSGITASNSVGGSSSYTCRTQAQWDDLAQKAKSSGFRSLRILGFDCDALNRASRAAEKEGTSVLAGIYIPGSVQANTAATNDDLKAFSDAYHTYGRDMFAGLTIGNEVNDSPAALISEVHRAQDYLRSSGVSTPVSTAHTWVEYRNNPVLCGGDFVAANAHAFFDGHVTAENAGRFVSEIVVPTLKATCPGKQIVITESGWPSRGPANGPSVTSMVAERTALANLNCAAKSMNDAGVLVYAFEYDDQLWKSSENEQSFGVFGKFSLEDILGAC